MKKTFNMPNICVLLSTFNGEKYLKEQIDSILSQKNVNVYIYVRDDGSTDKTKDILTDYVQKGQIEVMSDGNNKGFAASFLTLLKNAPKFDYYAYSDQDDIWLEEKLSRGITCLETLEGQNRLYSSNLTIWRNGVIEGQRYQFTPHVTPISSLNASCCYGCTCVFDNSLRETVLNHLHKKKKPIHAHDLWLFHTALYLGSYYYDNKSYIYYRQHDLNTIGAKTRAIDRFRSRLRSVKNIKAQHFREFEAQNLLECYSSLLIENQKQILEDITTYRNNFYGKFKLLINPELHLSFFDAIRIVIGSY